MTNGKQLWLCPEHSAKVGSVTEEVEVAAPTAVTYKNPNSTNVDDDDDGDDYMLKEEDDDPGNGDSTYINTPQSMLLSFCCHCCCCCYFQQCHKKEYLKALCCCSLCCSIPWYYIFHEGSFAVEAHCKMSFMENVCVCVCVCVFWGVLAESRM